MDTMIWFSYVVGPLGPSIRILYSVFIDIGPREYIERVAEIFSGREGLETRILCVDRAEDLYNISRLDPDMTDVLRGERLCVLMLSAGTRAMGTR